MLTCLCLNFAQVNACIYLLKKIEHIIIVFYS